jgi:long-chain acyl-CoA synthetase
MSELDSRFPHYPTVVHAFWDAVAHAAEQPAVHCEGRELSYAQLGRAVSSVAARCAGYGVRGQRVVHLIPNSVEAVVLALAVLAAHAQLAPINPFFKPPELEVVLTEAEPELVICTRLTAPVVKELAARLGIRAVWVLEDEAPLFDSVVLEPRSANESAGELPLPEDHALLIFTGGTTGTPKGVEHTHAALSLGLVQHCTAWPVDFGRERFLSVAPLFHIWGLAYATLVPLYSRGLLVIVPRYDPERVLHALEAHAITVFGGGPAPIYLGLIAHPHFSKTRFESLRYCLSGGAPCPRELLEAWRLKTGCALLEGWGMSEAAPLCLNTPEGPHKPGSVGRPVPLTEVQIVDIERGTELKNFGEPGEVRVRGPQVMLGYRKRARETADVLRDGWLYTGDIGTLDADGFLCLVDRKKDLVIVGGYNVYPRQVDEVLFTHPAVAEAACVGVPDPLLGEVLVAFIVPKSGVAASEQEILEFCSRQMVKYRRPVRITFLPELPRTAARKIDRRALKSGAS